MAEAGNLIPEHLRPMRGELDRMEHGLDDDIVRLGYVEQSAADHSVQLAEIMNKLDRLDASVLRIERRPDLAEG
jgi:hypothetical protein